MGQSVGCCGADRATTQQPTADPVDGDEENQDPKEEEEQKEEKVEKRKMTRMMLAVKTAKMLIGV